MADTRPTTNSRNAPVLLMNLPVPTSRSVSPMTPSPSRELRGVRLFRAISRKLGRRSNEDIYDNEDLESRSSSTDSCSSTSAGRRCSRPVKRVEPENHSSSGFRSLSPNGSDTGSDKRLSITSVRKVFQNLTLNTSRSQSCSQSETKRRTKKPSQPKRILRSPVTYTYVRGLSGLPTQRVPVASHKMYSLNNQNGCCCSISNVNHR